MFLHLCVILFTGGESLSRGVSVQGGLCPRGSLSGGCLCPGGLCPGGLCPRGVYVEEGSLSMGVSVHVDLCQWGGE